MSYELLDHPTDAIVQVTAGSLDEAFCVAAEAVTDITLERSLVSATESKKIMATGDNLMHLLYDWLESIIYQLVTEGFAISQIKASIVKDSAYTIRGEIHGEPIDINRHGFKVEIKAPTFHDMQITESEGVKLKFLLDL